MVLLFTGDSLGQIHPNPISLPVFPEMPGFDKRIMRHPLIAARSMLAFVDGQFTCSWLAFREMGVRADGTFRISATWLFPGFVLG